MSAKEMLAQKATDIAANLPPGATVTSGENIVYLMGLSFVIGSLFTILMLLLLDFMRRNRFDKRESDRRAAE